MAERTKLEMAQAWADIVIDRWRKRMAELEVNDKVQSQWQYLENYLHKRRRCYRKDI